MVIRVALTVPGAMNGESNTAPTSPPPDPVAQSARNWALGARFVG